MAPVRVSISVRFSILHVARFQLASYSNRRVGISLAHPAPTYCSLHVQSTLYPATRTKFAASKHSIAYYSSRSNLISRNLDQDYSRLSRKSPSIVPKTSLKPVKDCSKPSLTSTQTRGFAKSSTMSNQPSHPTLLIPGPIEVADDVLSAMATPAQSHVGQPFVEVFGETLSMLRKLFVTSNPASQPFVIAGSGTVGWDLVAANLVEPGEDVLVLHTGYFGDSFADCFNTYGAKAKQLKAPIGGRPQLPAIEEELKQKKYKAITVTHVDTSTGVLSEIAALSELVQRVSPDTLFIVDGVCSVGGEVLYFDEMKIDVVLTAPQKAIGCAPGLSISMVSERAMNVYKSRKSPPGSYYLSFKNWLPIMQNYEAKKPSYFATPPTQLVTALHAALEDLLSKPLKERFEQHQKVSQKVKKAVTEMGLKQLPTEPANAANTMTAIWLPEGLSAPQILPSLIKKSIIFAGGLHKDATTKYIRFGHMGVSAMDEKRGDIDRAIQALKDSLAEVQKS